MYFFEANLVNMDNGDYWSGKVTRLIETGCEFQSCTVKKIHGQREWSLESASWTSTALKKPWAFGFCFADSCMFYAVEVYSYLDNAFMYGICTFGWLWFFNRK